MNRHRSVRRAARRRREVGQRWSNATRTVFGATRRGFPNREVVLTEHVRSSRGPQVGERMFAVDISVPYTATHTIDFTLLYHAKHEFIWGFAQNLMDDRPFPIATVAYCKTT